MSDTLIYSREINIKNMLVFTVPTMVRMIFVSMYSIVDGIVVSNYVRTFGHKYSISGVKCMYGIGIHDGSGKQRYYREKIRRGKNSRSESIHEFKRYIDSFRHNRVGCNFPAI